MELVYDLSFEEERRLNDPIHSFKWVAENYRQSINPNTGFGLYEWEDITFYNTKLVSKAADHFRKYGTYNDIDPKTEPVYWDEWWDREEYRRIYGITLPIKQPKGGGISDKDLLPVWIPGKMYGHLNYGPIKRTKDPEDISLERLLKNQIDQDQRQSKEERLSLLFAGLSDNKVAQTTLDFPDFWDGHFHVYISIEFAKRLGLDASFFKARRKGFSYVGGWIAFDEFDLYPNNTVCLVAYDTKYLTKGDGLMVMATAYSDHINKFTDWSKGRLIDTTDSLKLGYKLKGEPEEYGYKSNLLALSAKDNPSVVRGKNARLVLYEEWGTFPNIIATSEATRSTTESGNYVIGQQLYWGTIGSEDAEYEGLAKMHYNPTGYNILQYKNKYDRNPTKPGCGCFFSHLQNMEGAIDEHGNSDIEKARAIFEKQKVIKEANSDASTFAKWSAERATIPSEALATKTVNLFSKYKNDILLQIQRIEADPFIKSITRCGQYIRTDYGVEFISNEDANKRGLETHPPVDDDVHSLPRDHDPHGCIVEWALPFMRTIFDGVRQVSYIPDNLYYGRLDPYATDKDQDDIILKDSIGALYIYEAVNKLSPSRGDRLVASWLGRPDTTDKYNEQLFLCLERWNAKLLYENDRGNVYEYAKQFKLTHLLQEEPELLSMKELGGTTGRKYGISIGKHKERKTKGALLLRDRLGYPAGTDELGNIRNFIYYVYCRRLLKELLQWKLKGNFDCVSAMIVGEFQIMELFDQEVQEDNEQQFDPNSFWNREFFK